MASKGAICAASPGRAAPSCDYCQGSLAARVLEVVNTYEGTHDVHALIIGRAITGIAAFS